MSPTTTKKPLEALPATTPPSSGAPIREAEATFLPSSELGEQLERLEQAQVEIDRKQAEELARLRELQDRD